MTKAVGEEHPDQFEPAFVLYRAALVQVRAAQRATRARTPARRRQEADAAAATIILTQAALEGWIKAACLRAGIPTGRRKWLELWTEEPQRLREIFGPPADVELPTLPDLRFLLMMNDMRNYLVHGDENARRQASRHLDGGPPEVVLAYYPALVVTGAADDLFNYGMTMTGLLAPTRQRLLDLQPDLLR